MARCVGAQATVFSEEAGEACAADSTAPPPLIPPSPLAQDCTTDSDCCGWPSSRMLPNLPARRSMCPGGASCSFKEGSAAACNRKQIQSAQHVNRQRKVINKQLVLKAPKKLIAWLFAASVPGKELVSSPHMCSVTMCTMQCCWQ